MPQTIQHAAPTLAQFQQVTDNTSEKGSIVFKNGAFAPAVEAFAQKNNLSEAQQQELKAVVQTELSQRPRLFPGAEERQSLVPTLNNRVSS